MYLPIAIGETDNAGNCVARRTYIMMTNMQPLILFQRIADRYPAIGMRYVNTPFSLQRHTAVGTGIGKKMMIIDYCKRGDKRQGECLRGNAVVEYHPLVRLLKIAGKEGNRHTVAMSIMIRSAQQLAKREGGIVALHSKAIKRIIHKTGGENMEDEESREIYSAVQAQAVAQSGSVNVAKGTPVEQAVHAAIKKRVAHDATERVPHHGTLVITGGAIRSA